MHIITKDFVHRIDDKLISADVALHARPFCVVIEWMKEKNITGDILDKKIWEPLMRIYKCLYPKGNFSIPSLMVGGVALRDAMYPVHIKHVIDGGYHGASGWISLRRSFISREVMRTAVFNYIECDYNRWRRHSACGGSSPEQFENQNLD